MARDGLKADLRVPNLGLITGNQVKSGRISQEGHVCYLQIGFTLLVDDLIHTGDLQLV